MHGQITYSARVLYRSRCACGWQSEETEFGVDADLAFDEHIAPFRIERTAASPCRSGQVD